MSDTPTNAAYAPIAASSQSTVVAEFVPDPAGDTAYQSEAQLEAAFIAQLRSQAYEYLPITTEAELVANLRARLETLNDLTFSDTEWHRFFTEVIAAANDGIIEKTVRIQEDHVQLLHRDDGTVKNVKLIDKTNIHNNHLQVINQYETDAGTHSNRYDVTVLVNGLPLVHIELKRRGVDLREAFNQINRYRRDSFWSGSGLFDYVQLFVISNGTLTRYYANTVRARHIDERTPARHARKSSNTYAFTSTWADATNKSIDELVGFTKTFFAKHTLLHVLTRYCVLTVDRSLLVMRPYQIVATEAILQRVAVAGNHRRWGSVAGGGYIWHTTGSGKTLTSFKTAQLATRIDGVTKVLFVVDRKDLDYQTMREYDRFEKGAANSNTSTKVLKAQLENPDVRIIITTIQKLATFIKANPHHAVYDARIVIIFDECHRSQFGDMHTAITGAFKRYHLFGFTGTPIFAANSGTGGNPQLRTTEQAFGDKLHTYTIVDAIRDHNVLPFRIDYVNTIKMPARVDDKQVSAIDTEEALLAPERIAGIVDYICAHFDQKTKRSASYSHSIVTNVGAVAARRGATDEVRAHQRVRGFNALLATASISAAKRYYNAFYLAQRDLPSDQRLKVGLIYSYAPNEAEPDATFDDDSFDAAGLDGPSREFLEDAIAEYNELFGTSYDTTAEKFGNYYRDLSLRLKNREIDLVIVVNMFLTGFDATTLNTLWVDKNLRAHGLIQAYSRTNRILNSVKTFGNIVTFRDLEAATNDAIALFGNPDARGIVVLKPYGDYRDDYTARVAELLTTYPLGAPIDGEAAQKAFIALFGTILRLRNILTSFDEFGDDDVLTPRQIQDYQSRYLDLYQTFRAADAAEKESIIDDVTFEIELIKQVEITVDYILLLVEAYRAAKGDGDDKEVYAGIVRAVDASPTLRNKKDLIEAFIASLSADADIDDAWRAFVDARRTEELDAIIAGEHLDAEATAAFMDGAFRDGAVQTDGTAIVAVLPPMSKFTPDAGYATKKATVVAKLTAFFDRFAGLG